MDALLDLLLADGGRTGGIYFHIDEGDVRTIMRDPHVGVGSDGLYTGRPGRAGRAGARTRGTSAPSRGSSAATRGTRASSPCRRPSAR